MTAPLFRPEAVAHHESVRARRTEVRLREGTTARAYQVLVATVLLALFAAYAVRADETARGPATATGDGRTAEVLLPAAARARLEVGARGTLAGAALTVTAIGPIRAAGRTAVVPVTVTLDRPVPDGGTATVSLRRTRVIDLVTGRG